MKTKPVIASNSQTVLCSRYLRPIKEPVKPPEWEGDDPTSKAIHDSKVEDYETAVAVYGRHTCPHCGKHHETVEEMFERCSFGSEEFYNLLASLDFLPNSPTLFNGGTNQGTYSGCFKFDVEDTMDSILDVARKAALVLKWGGGTGFYTGKIRPENSLIHTTHGKACGPVAVAEYYHAGAKLITQSGKRQAAQMGILDCYHPDVKQFIHCKDVPVECKCSSCLHLKDCTYSHTKVLSTFNLSVSCTDAFMKKAEEVGTEENKLFEEMVDSAWKRGDPGMFFVDAANRANPTPWLGPITGTNACGEVPLLDNEPCNLGSVNLGHMVTSVGDFEDAIDWSRLERTVRLAVRYMNTVLDMNDFPVPELKEAALLTRKIGLGVMGWADLLAQLHIHYDTDLAVELANHVMSKINDWGHDESKKLALELGPCPVFYEHDGITGPSNWRDGVPHERNATITCIAPAGSICTIANCSSGIEPHYTLHGDRVMGDGKTHLTEDVRVDTHGFVPHTAHEIDWIWHIRHQAAFQKHTDLAVSKTINLKNSATREDVRNAFIAAWQMKCKGITVYRDGSRETQVITEKKDVPVELYPTDTKLGAHRRKMPKDAEAKRHGFRVGDTEGYLHVGLFPEGDPGEMFITGSNQGSTVSGLLACLSIVTSLALQHGTPLETIVSKLQHVNFEPRGLTDDPDIPTAPSIVAYIYRYMGKRFLDKDHQVSPGDTGMACPNCGAKAISQSGCLECSAGCGWSRCG